MSPSCLETLPRGGAGFGSAGLFSVGRPVFSVGLCWDTCSAAPCPPPRGDRAGLVWMCPPPAGSSSLRPRLLDSPGWRLSSPQEGTWLHRVFTWSQKHSLKRASGERKERLHLRASGLGFPRATGSSLSGGSCRGAPSSVLRPLCPVTGLALCPKPPAPGQAVTTGDVSTRGSCFDDEEGGGAVVALASGARGASGCRAGIAGFG